MAVGEHTNMSPSLRKLNVGCGEDWKMGYLNIDIEPPSRHYGDGEFLRGDVTDLFGIVGRGHEGKGYDEILAVYVVEHIAVELLYDMFYSWNRTLRLGGVVTIIVPDFVGMMERYEEDSSLATFRLFLYELTAHIGVSPHTSVWTVKWLEHFLNSEGFTMLEYERRIGSAGVGLKVVAHKTEIRDGGEIII